MENEAAKKTQKHAGARWKSARKNEGVDVNQMTQADTRGTENRKMPDHASGESLAPTYGKIDGARKESTRGTDVNWGNSTHTTVTWLRGCNTNDVA